MDIIRHGMVSVLSDGSLQLNPEEGSGEGSGTLVDTLPTLPAHVDAVAISWHASMEVSWGRGKHFLPLYHVSCIGAESALKIL